MRICWEVVIFGEKLPVARSVSEASPFNDSTDNALRESTDRRDRSSDNLAIIQLLFYHISHLVKHVLHVDLLQKGICLDSSTTSGEFVAATEKFSVFCWGQWLRAMFSLTHATRAHFSGVGALMTESWQVFLEQLKMKTWIMLKWLASLYEPMNSLLKLSVLSIMLDIGLWHVLKKLEICPSQSCVFCMGLVLLMLSWLWNWTCKFSLHPSDPFPQYLPFHWSCLTLWNFQSCLLA